MRDRAQGWLRLAAVLALLFGMGRLEASGPRYVTGPPFFTGAAGVGIGWKQANLLYSTDPGDLGVSVNHQAADALVAAAAGVWNVPVASITVGQGVPLAEHVSGANVYLSSEGMVWPADVMSTNAAAVPIAIVYDTDGSVTDTLLGAGASDPSGCAQNAVTESVDRFAPAGYILHAILVLNGRCTGPAPEQQMQMQYQLERVFGRVLGLAWSQTNDNVFTGTPTPTYDQEKYWPIMHPMDILCGPYSYQCLVNPFSLRPDDVAGLVGLYPIAKGTTPAAGKQVSLTDADAINGFITFPTGEGMAGVNVLVKREPRFTTTPQDWFETSAVTGSSFRRAGVSPFVSADTSAAGSFGTTAVLNQGYYFVPYFGVIDPYNVQGDIVSIEPVNPLYIGSASVGPYAVGMAAPAGSAPIPFNQVEGPGGTVTSSFQIADAPATCGDGTDGTLAMPMVLPVSGWWNGLICGYGHASYVAAEIQAGRSLTVEVTALDGNGFATTTKAMPVIGLFAPTDAAGSLPSLGVTPAAFQALGIGVTTLSAAPFAAGGAAGVVRIGIADQRGDGRPDFGYQARLFYADNVVPSTVAIGGGVVTLTGSGFRAGNVVTINGVAATVVSWSATTIVFAAPSMAVAGAVSGVPVDVEVTDLGTGASSTMTGAMTYGAGALPNTMRLVSAPTAAAFVGATTPGAFAVQVLQSDGVTPVAGDAVVFSSTAKAAQFTACGATVCSVLTDANGMASTGVVPLVAGTVALGAADGALGVSASFQAEAKPNTMKVALAPTGNLPVGVVAATPFQVQVLTASGAAVVGELVTFSVTAGAATFGLCSAAPCSVTTNVHGQAQMTVTPSAAGAITITATDGSLAQSVSFVGTANANILTLVQVPTTPAYTNVDAGGMSVTLTLGNGVTPIAGAPIVLTAPAGVTWDACGTSVCVLDTNPTGAAGSTVQAHVAGTFVLQASYGGLAVTATMQAMVRASTLTIVSAPSGTVSVGAKLTPLSAQLLDGYGKAMAGYPVTLAGTEARELMGCGLASCVLTTDGNGMVTTSLTATGPGMITLAATSGALNATASFTAVGGVETLRLVTAPPAVVSVGDKVTFAVSTVGPDGVTPMPSRLVTLEAIAGSFAINGCPYASCRPNTGATGVLTVSGISPTPGLVTILCGADGLTLQFSFMVVAKTNTMKTVTAPSGSVTVGAVLANPFTVQVLAADGVTGVSGSNVTFSLANGNAQLAACAVTPCVVVTNAMGIASTGVITTSSVGAVTVLAADNAMSQTAGFTVVTPVVRTLVAEEPQTYVAAGATVTMELDVMAVGDGSAVAGQSVAWTGSAEFATQGSSSTTDATGHGSVQATLGPIAAGAQGTVNACAWATVCAQFQATGVSNSALEVAIASGGLQAVTGSALNPVVALVTDGSGHPVVGVPVTVGQTARALDVACPSQGRCPVGGVLATASSVVVSDLQGMVSVTPLVVPGTATLTALAFSAGTQGFATAEVSSTP